jgi:ArsR family transcriptional regulator
MELLNAAKQLEALGNPTRLALFRELVQTGDTGLSVGEIQVRLKIPASTLTHHVARLVQCGLVDQRREGRILVCTSDYQAMNSLIGYLQENCCTENG